MKYVRSRARRNVRRNRNFGAPHFPPVEFSACARVCVRGRVREYLRFAACAAYRFARIARITDVQFAFRIQLIPRDRRRYLYHL